MILSRRHRQPSYLSGDRVAAIGRLNGNTAKRTIDTSGLTVAPGFIEIHNHAPHSEIVGEILAKRGILNENKYSFPSSIQIPT